MKGQRKFLSEFAINLFTSRFMIVPVSQLTAEGTMPEGAQEVADDCHIYLICRHPSPSYVPEAFRYSEGMIEGKISYKVDGNPCTVDFSHTFRLSDGAVDIKVSPYPHREIQTFDKAGAVVRYLAANNWFMMPSLRAQDARIGKYKVLYVGQAYAEGKRSAFDRLKSHSTLQKVLAAAQYETPDDEIFLFMFKYEPYRVILNINGADKKAIRDERDNERFWSVLDNPLTEHQQICLAEAALIRHFAPKYNKIYKDTFPSPTHEILRECYGLDFSGLIVEIDTEDLDVSIYSDAVEPDTHHTCKIDLLGHNERLGFFDLPDGEGSSSVMPGVIS